MNNAAMLKRKWKRRIWFIPTFAGCLTFLWISELTGVKRLQGVVDSFHGARRAPRKRGMSVEVIVGHYNGPLPGRSSATNYTQDELDANRFDPRSDMGKEGQAVRLNAEDDALADHLFQINQFNIIASDRIPLNRSLPDVRRVACRSKVYPTELPPTSVIIVFHNEAWSTLLRTVLSVINRSPKHLLKEIILVDDFSSRAFLKGPLEDYVATLPVKVFVIRATKRSGLIQARLLGAERATGDVLTFLDSHCECAEGWLEPLLARISQDKFSLNKWTQRSKPSSKTDQSWSSPGPFGPLPVSVAYLTEVESISSPALTAGGRLVGHHFSEIIDILGAFRLRDFDPSEISTAQVFGGSAKVRRPHYCRLNGRNPFVTRSLRRAGGKHWNILILAKILNSNLGRSDGTVVVCPVIDVINDRTFQYQKGIDIFRGGFNWNLQFRWYSTPPSELKRRGDDPTAPLRTPTMAGGLFSIDRKYFFRVGSYDREMKIWGGENLEMSFRVWQCGGKLEIMPCSHVGHIFRKKSPHDFPGGSSSKTLSTNLARMAEVWMDEWKHVFYMTSSVAANLSSTVDVAERRELRKKLNCKDFSWYLNNVWPEHFMPTDDSFFGRIRHTFYNKCLQLVRVKAALGKGTETRISAEPCTSNYQQVKNMAVDYCLVNKPIVVSGRKSDFQFSRCTKGLNLWQFWVHYRNGALKGDEHQCLSASQITSGQWVVQLKECVESKSERWLHAESHLLIHRQSGLCLDSPLNMNDPTVVHLPVLNKCSKYSKGQLWQLEPVDWKHS